MKTVNVLGGIYKIIVGDRNHDSTLDRADGYCDYTNKTCVIDSMPQSTGQLADMDSYKKQVIRHEIVHAFLFESGLGTSSWGGNEEIVDWIAFQFPKLLEAFKEADAL